MRYRSAAFARLSAHALAGVGSTHFPARGVDADALLGIASHKIFVPLVPFKKVAREVLSDGTGLTLACVLRLKR